MKACGRFARIYSFVLLAAAAFKAGADNTESGGGPIDFGGAAAVYIVPPGMGSDGGARLRLSQQDLGKPATVSLSAPSPAYNDAPLAIFAWQRSTRRMPLPAPGQQPGVRAE